MTFRRLTMGEKPIPGKFYLCLNYDLHVRKNLECFFEETIDEEQPLVVIPRKEIFFFIDVVFESKEPDSLKHSWYQVLYKKQTGIVYNNQVPFHYFLAELVDGN